MLTRGDSHVCLARLTSVARPTNKFVKWALTSTSRDTVSTKLREFHTCEHASVVRPLPLFCHYQLQNVADNFSPMDPFIGTRSACYGNGKSGRLFRWLRGEPRLTMNGNDYLKHADFASSSRFKQTSFL